MISSLDGSFRLFFRLLHLVLLVIISGFDDGPFWSSRFSASVEEEEFELLMVSEDILI